MASRAANRFRKLALALPEAYEKPTWESATFRVGRDKIFCMLVDDGGAVWLKADPEERPALLGDPHERYFHPPYVGHKGWIGIDLTSPHTDWEDIAELVRTSYVLIAPKKLSKLLDDD
jgi:predicted DNA-binding protein (MmcQ/YjbR family)